MMCHRICRRKGRLRLFSTIASGECDLLKQYLPFPLLRRYQKVNFFPYRSPRHFIEIEEDSIIQSHLFPPELPIDTNERAALLKKAVSQLPNWPSKKVNEPSTNLGALWPLCDRQKELDQIASAVENNRRRFLNRCVEKQDYQCVVVTGAAGSGKTRLCHEGMRAIVESHRAQKDPNFSNIYEVFITFLNGEQITTEDAVGDTPLEQASVALGIRLACRLFPKLGLCSRMPLETFRQRISTYVNLRLVDLRTVMRVLASQAPTAKPILVLLTLDESYYAEFPQDDTSPKLWHQMMSKLLEYVIPGEDYKPQVEDNVVLFPIVSSTWTVERTRALISPVDKVFLDLAPLSRFSLFDTICTRERLGEWFTPATSALLQDARFQSFLLSCAQAPRAVATAIECISELVLPAGVVNDDFRALAVKQVCLKMHDFYKRVKVNHEVLELALSGVCLPEELENVRLGGQTIVKWLAMGFATGGETKPIAVPFPLLYSQAGVLISGMDRFLNWGQPFHWQDFEALVPHIIRLRCSSLYRIAENHCATLAEIFGIGSAALVQLHVDMTVVTCSNQWLVPKRGSVKTVAQQLKVSKRDSTIKVGQRFLDFGSIGHIFAALDGNVHFDGHLSFRTVDGRSVLVCYQVKHTHITEENVAQYSWAQADLWLAKAREFMAGYVVDMKVFVMITNKKVHPLPVIFDEDFIMIHAGNLESFFAPCILSSAMLASDDGLVNQ